jgi:hypothetical protein
MITTHPDQFRPFDGDNSATQQSCHVSMPSAYRSGRRDVAALATIIAVFGLLLAPLAFCQEPNTPKKTGTLKDGEKCEQLPCTCGNAPATAVGCVCSLDQNLGPASGSFTCPEPVVQSSIVVTTVIIVVIVGLLIYFWRRQAPPPPPGPVGAG